MILKMELMYINIKDVVIINNDKMILNEVDRVTKSFKSLEDQIEMRKEVLQQDIIAISSKLIIKEVETQIRIDHAFLIGEMTMLDTIRNIIKDGNLKDIYYLEKLLNKEDNKNVNRNL